MKLAPLLVICAAWAGLAGCGAQAETTPAAFTVQTRPLPLDPDDPQTVRVGALTYAGGLALSAPDTDAFGGLSGLDVEPDGSFLSQSDKGALVRGRIVLDQAGRLAGLSSATIAQLTDEAGRPVSGKAGADAEDITFLPGGGYAVSFEHDHRVIAYPPAGLPMRLGMPAEAASFPENLGLEALTAWTDGRGRKRLVEGSEDGRAWSCDLQGRDCSLLFEGAPEKDFNLTGLDALPGDAGLVAVYRAFDLIRGMRALVVWVRPEAKEKLVVLARLVPPYSVDNMEGIAALPNPDGSIRLYLISDDNFLRIQRTLLLAFDWRR